MRARGALRLLISELLAQPRALFRLAAWSLPTALPAMLSGRFIALATDRGFLAHRPAVGAAWLGAFGACMIAGAFGSRQTLCWLGALVEPARDALVRAVVTGTVSRSVTDERQPDAGAVAQLTEQIEIVRGALGGLLVGSQQLVFTLGGALAGLFLLSPVLLIAIAPPVVISLVLLSLLLAALFPRQRAWIAADEKIASSVGAVIRGMRDIVACGAADRTAGHMDAEISAQAAATRALARAEALRTGIVAIGVRLPMVLMLVAGRWLIRTQHLSTGDILGAVTYVSVSAAPVVTYVSTTIGTSALQLAAVLDRISVAARLPAPMAAEPEAMRDAQISRCDMELSGCFKTGVEAGGRCRRGGCDLRVAAAGLAGM